MSTRNAGAAVSGTMLSRAELAVRLDEDLVALIASNSGSPRSITATAPGTW